MKKRLLSGFLALTTYAVVAQTTSSSWNINQNAMFATTNASAGVKFMDAVDANVVWVIGFDPFSPSANYNWYSRSTNGGTSFSGGNIFNDTSTYIIANMEGIDANTAWVTSFERSGPNGGSGGGAIHRTTNGGSTWVNMNATGMFTASTSFANWVTFLTPSVGIANGDPVNGEYEMWRTTNGGLNWTQIPGSNIPDPAAGEFAIVNLYAKVGTNNLWFGTNSNVIYRSTDAGLTYSASMVGGFAASGSTITEIAFSSPLKGVCYMVNGGLELWNTIDGGINWTQVTPLPANLGQADVTAVPGTGILVSYGLVIGTNEIISYSTDNGLTWTDWGSVGIGYTTGDFVDGTTGWAGGYLMSASSAPFNATNVWKYSAAPLTGTVSPAASFSAPTDVCLTGPTATISPVNSSLGSPTPTYTWSVQPAGATISNPNAINPTITFPSANSYTIFLLASSATGTNLSSQIVNVAACAAPVVNISTPANVCNKIAFVGTASVVSGAPAPSFSWTVNSPVGGGATLIPGPFAQNPSITATPGTHTLTLVSTNAQGNVTSTQTITVPDCSPAINFSATSAICASDATIRVSATNSTIVNPIAGANSYSWTVSPSGTNITSPTNSTSPNGYSVTLRNTNQNYTITLRSKNAVGTATLTKVILTDPCVGISEQISGLVSVLVYPNPAHDQVNVTLPSSTETIELRMINVLGAVVYDESISKNTKETVNIKLADKPKGVYFLTIKSGNEKITKKIIVE